MKVLNLVYPDKSNIKYKISKFPDGQQSIVITDNNISTQNYLSNSGTVQIKSRLNNWLDLELIICAVASLRELGITEIHLYAPYIVGARSDRKFEDGGNNYLKDVICPVINSLGFKSVTCIDPHSDVLEACIKGFRKQSNFELVRYALHRMPFEYNTISNHKILVSPDAGASKKIYKLAEQIGYKGDIITCSKDRDINGKLTRTIVPVKDTGPLCKKDYIIIDDICDGGATFINIAKELKKLYNYNKIYLIVTHGIFSKGFTELSKYFDGIYCTNSYSDLDGYYPIEENKEGAISNGILVKKISDLVKQLNVY